MLTLHCLFPNELLLALDILDRRLVKRFIVREESELASAAGTEEGGGEVSLRGITQRIYTRQDDEEIYIVRSLSSARGGPPKSYEVRLRSWNCTCPAFALSAFRDVETHDAEVARDTASYLPDDETSWFGGTLTRDPSRSSLAVCKHLLACVLGVRCPSLFGDGIEETCMVTPTELAGRCAGWAG
ncbi:hypothetical protein VTN77DRAFT_3300 [Rasamsonia byssochlamydoides]|uniref:uncharacterized protein n=1 Tax=Rasamsonia byssochlamydoides TaxID=89139 RepID=UPI0037448EE3